MSGKDLPPSLGATAARDPETTDTIRDGLGRNALFSAIQSSRMPMILTDPHQHDNPIIFANRSFEKLSGYPAAELIGRNCRFLQGEDTAPEIVAKIRHAIETRTKIAIDIVNYRKDGQRFVNELYISPVFGTDGDLLYFFGSQVDVTAYTEARLSMQLTLIERERYVLSQIAEGVPLGQVLEDLLRVVEGQNDHGMRTSILFVSEDGRHLRHGAAPNLPPAYNAAINGIAIGEGIGSCGTAASRGTPVFAVDIANDPLWVDFRDLALSHNLRSCWSTPIKATQGHILGTFAIYYDTPRTPTREEIAAIGFVTQTTALAVERHRNDLALRRGEERLQAANQELLEVNGSLERTVAERTETVRLFGEIVQSDASPILAFDHDYRVIAFNKAHAEDFQRVMGLHQQIGDVLPDQFPPEQGEVLRGLMDRALAGERFVIVQQFGDPGREVPTWEITYTPLHDATGQVTGAFHHARDITDRVQAEHELSQLQEQLVQSQKLEAIGQLTGGVAHDFNNLLTIIRSSVDFLRRPELPDERKARYLDAVSETVERAARLTGQLLAFARRQALIPEVFDVGARLRDVGDMLDTVTGARIHVAINVPERPCFVRADVSQFETALVNMAVNARDAMDGEGELTLRLHCVSPMPQIRGHASSSNDFAAISVTDTGMGIAPGQLTQIFEPFFTTKEVGKGTGLGLSQVFGFAKQSGGDVDVQSTIGKGATFTLYLPEIQFEPSNATAGGDDQTIVPISTGQRVLVVEDNIEVGRFCTQILDDLGYVTAWVANGEEALDKLGADSAGFDAVFSDVVMPGMGGVALAEILRKRLPRLPVVLTSGYSHVLAREADHGFELLHKPYSAEQLGRVLQRAMSRGALRQTQHATA